MRIPLGGFTPRYEKMFLYFNGHSIISLSCLTTSPIPPRSLNDMEEVVKYFSVSSFIYSYAFCSLMKLPYPPSVASLFFLFSRDSMFPSAAFLFNLFCSCYLPAYGSIWFIKFGDLWLISFSSRSSWFGLVAPSTSSSPSPSLSSLPFSSSLSPESLLSLSSSESLSSSYFFDFLLLSLLFILSLLASVYSSCLTSAFEPCPGKKSFFLKNFFSMFMFYKSNINY